MSVSSDWEISTTTAAAQLAGMLVRADMGSVNSRLSIYTTQRPARITDNHASTAQAEIVLAKPCGVVVGGALVLYVRDSAGALVQFNGLPRWAEWTAGDGAVLTRCDVSDMDNGGGIRLIGGTTPEGETSPMLYAGGLVQLGVVALT
ncbi:MAG: hypothetical protein E2582_05110 [Delftia sp.]|nr:hypothetical protein [Delftia sp.]